MSRRKKNVGSSVMSSTGRTARLPMTGLDWFGLAMMILLGACSLVLLIKLLATHMLTNWLLLALVVALLIFNGLNIWIQLPRRRNKMSKLIFSIISLALSFVMIYGVIAAGSIQAALMNISGKLVQRETTYVIVMRDDPANTINDVENYRFGSLAHMDEKNAKALQESVNGGFSNLNNTPYDSITTLTDALYDDEVDAIMLNSGYVSILEDMPGYEDFSEQTRVLYEFTTERKVDSVKPNKAITKEPFVVYCSGIDARNPDITVTSLSDVNILALVNPRTHQVLLLNTPRDYYLPLVSDPYAGQPDKLTHAGGIGIEESMAVLSNFYGVDPSYYVRINFTGMEQIVDALGGIDVMSPCDFTTASIEMPGYDYRMRYSFTEGMNHLNGEEALAFSRERKAFAMGDIQRGKNQMTVIKAIVDKATSPQILSNYQNLLKAIEGCFATNMPYEDISALVKMQLSDMADWNITSYSVSGYGDYLPCPSAGGQALSVLVPSDEDMATAKTLIDQLMNDEVPTIPES